MESELVPSEAPIVCCPATDEGIVIAPINAPELLDVTGKSGRMVLPSNVNVIGLDAIKPEPCTVVCEPMMPEIGLTAIPSTTVNVEDAVLAKLSDASIVLSPGVSPSGIVSTAEKLPPPKSCTGESGVIGLPSSVNVMADDDGEKCEPDIMTWVPVAPEFGLKKIDGDAVTVNWVEAETVPSDDTIACEPVEDEGIVIVPTNPPVLLDVTARSGRMVLSSNVNEIGVEGAKPVPDIVTCVPAGPDDGLGEMDEDDIVNCVNTELVPSEAPMVFTPTLPPVTVNVPVNPPVLLDVTARSGRNVLLSNVNEIGVEGAKPVPDIVMCSPI